MPEPRGPEREPPDGADPKSPLPWREDAPTLDPAAPAPGGGGDGDGGSGEATIDSSTRHGGGPVRVPPRRRAGEADPYDPTVAIVHGAAPDDTPIPGLERIGRYRVLGVVGMGGMGVVYRAEQDSPKRVVALKVIKPGSTSHAQLRRFEHEAELLGRLRHPGIAQVYDAGTADTPMGRTPFFAMELIKGVPINEYLRTRRPAMREVLALFAEVCDAVQHAHTKGVIHRDLKPGNILVDETGQPKVLDFGVARLADNQSVGQTLQTDVGTLVGTVPYMSPEQISGDPAQMDTRSDVYTLGVVLFELLSGDLPHEVRGRSVPETVRIVTEQEPTRLGSVLRAARGDVETIVCKALEKDRNRRYQTAADLAADLRRYLGDEPIMARPPSTLYQMRKFARRHTALVAAAGAVLLAMVLGIVGTSWQAVRATRAAAEATLQRDAALSARDTAQATADYLRRMMRSPDPTQHVDGREVKFVDVLRRAETDIPEAFPEKPVLAADLFNTIGITYYSLGLLEEAQVQFGRAHERYAQALGEGSPEALTQLNNIAVILRDRGRLGDAEPIFQRVLARQVEALGEAHPDTALTLDNLAEVYRRQSRLDRAEEYFRRSLAIRRALAEADPAQGTEAVYSSMNNLALALRDRGGLVEAATLLEDKLEHDQRRYADDPRTPELLTTMHNLALVRAELGELEQAEALQRRVLAARLEVLGPEHPHTLSAQKNLAATLRQRGVLGEALMLTESSLETMRRVLGERHGLTLAAWSDLGEIQRLSGDPERAVQTLRACAQAERESLNEDNIALATTAGRLACALADAGRPAEAEPLHQRALTAATRTLGEGHWRTAMLGVDYARTLSALDRPEQAELELERAVRVLEAQLGAGNRLAAAARAELSTLTRR